MGPIFPLQYPRLSMGSTFLPFGKVYSGILIIMKNPCYFAI